MFVILQFHNWSATEKTVDNENLEAHSAIFQVKKKNIFLNLLADVSVLHCPS